MHWNRNFSIFVVLYLFALSGVSFAEGELVSQSWREIVGLYAKNEFANGNLTLRKFDLVGKVPISIVCEGLVSSTCESAKTAIDQAVEENVNLQFILSATPAITFVFANNSGLNTLSPRVIDEFHGEVSDVSDPECEVFYQLTGSHIERGKLLASIDQPANKLRACLIVQISRLVGPGFSLTDSFSLRWKASLSKENDEQLDQTRHISSILEYIQMCPELIPGLPESEVKRILLSPSSCISKLELNK